MSQKELMSADFVYDPANPFDPFKSSSSAPVGSLGDQAKMTALETMEKAGKLNAEQRTKLAQLREQRLQQEWAAPPASPPPAPEPPPTLKTAAPVAQAAPPQAAIHRPWEAAFEKQGAGVPSMDALMRAPTEPYPFIRPTPASYNQVVQSAPPRRDPSRGSADTVTPDQMEEVRRRIQAQHNASSEESIVGRLEAQDAVEHRARNDIALNQMPLKSVDTPRFSSRGSNAQGDPRGNEPWLSKMSDLQGLQDNAELFGTSTTPPVRLMRALNSALGEEWLGWEWETIEEELGRAGVACDPIVRDKILALKLLVNSNEFFEGWRAFSAVVTAFADQRVDWSYVAPLAPHHMAAAAAIATRYIRSEPPEWSPEVRAFVAACCVNSGLVKLPPELLFAGFEFANELLKRMGDEALYMQQRIDALVSSDEAPLQDEAEAIQLRRLLRIQYHVAAATDEANR